MERRKPRLSQSSSQPTTDCVVDEDETSSTGFSYVETTVIVESHNASEKLGASEEAIEGRKENSQSKIIFVVETKNFLPEEDGGSSKSIGLLGTSAVSDEKLLHHRAHRLLSLQKPGESIGLLQDPRTTRRAYSLEERINSLTSEDVQQKLRMLSSEFSKRANRKKAKIRKPLTPTSDLSYTSEEEQSEEQLQKRLMEFLPRPAQESTINLFDQIRQRNKSGWKSAIQFYANWLRKCICFEFVLDSQSQIYIGWLVLMSAWFLYNAWVIPLRSIFRFQTPQNTYKWFIADSIADFFYVLDTFIMKSRIMYTNNSFTVKDPQEIRMSYFSSVRFKIGLVSLIPVDIFFAIFGQNTPWLRAFRLLKIDCFWEMFLKFDSVVASPHPIRITRSILYMLYLIHMYACAYYSLSTWELSAGYRTDWIFNDADLNSYESYIRCFYFATKTATSIGKNPKPENEIEYLFMSCAWLSGVFAFAILIGQIRDIIATASKNQTEYRQLLYAAVNYLHRLDVPKDLQDRVKLWFTYTWQQQRTLDEQNILSLLPQKMQTDIALHVHIEMLNKVKLFQQCEVAFLRDLVPCFRSVIFLPGDYVCRKGEVGKEMYIIKTGSLDVIGGVPGKEIKLASLGSGSIFGEIALLQVDGMDKRTADVRSAGFSNLFVLTKKALAEVIKDYPAAQESLRRQAKRLMKLSQKRRKLEKSKAKLWKRRAGLKEGILSESDSDSVDVIIKEDAKAAQPKMIETILQVVPSDSKTARYLQFGTKGESSHSIPDACLFESYPPSPFIAMDSTGFRRNSDISFNSSVESINMFQNDVN